jgi:hypothetical protein
VITDDLLQNDEDLDGRPLNLACVSPVSTRGALVSIADTRVIYTPLRGFTGLDTFSYTIANGEGGTAQGTVQVTVLDTPNPLHWIRAALASDRVVLGYTGVPEKSYELETTTNLDSRTWNVLQTFVPSANGFVELELTNCVSPSFFRIKAADD